MKATNDIIRYVTPEAAGIPSANVERYIRALEDNHLATHSIIIARGNDILFENYWAPFHKDFLHRLYSSSKSYVSLAIGFLEQDGLISLDDKMSKYFAKELEHQPDQNMHNQTIRHMLMMSTCKTLRDFFRHKEGLTDRVQFYFDNDTEYSRPSGTLFEYDSDASFILNALVERITGKPFMEYLKDKVLREIGVSDEVYCLKCPGGHSFGDSAVMSSAKDFFRVARFVLNGGSWNGRQLLNREYVEAATTKQIDNNYQDVVSRNTHGYGYQFWMERGKAFYFSGMGSQFAVCVPEKDLILVCNADNQGKEDLVKDLIFDHFFEWIVDAAAEDALDENPASYAHLMDYAGSLRLLTAHGEKHSECEKEIGGVTYIMNKNPMGITRMRLTFEGDMGCLSYTNEQGDKEIRFGMCANEFGEFPQAGYASDIATVPQENFYYQCVEERKLRIMVQIIDRYFGNLHITLSFLGNDLGVYMHKTAQDFLNEYQGYAHGKAQRD